MSTRILRAARAAALAVLALSACGAPVPRAAAADRSILLIIADDYGVDAAGFYPKSAARRATTPPAPPTPNLAALASKGVLFRQAWAEPWCSPSRAAILTGRHPFRTGVGTPVPQARVPHPVLSPDEFSLPEAFEKAKPGRYVLASIGKWHLSRGADDPRLHGWPYFAGPDPDLARLDDYYDWPKTVNGATTAHFKTYATTDQVDETLGVIRRAKAEGRPYFVWLAFSAPHSPYQKPPNHLHSRDSLPATGASRRAYYEAMVEAMDTEIGRLFEEVDLATTTVIFIGDNGTPAEVTAKPYSGKRAKGTPYQGGVRVPLLVAGADVVAPGRVVPRIVSAVDLYPTILRLAGVDPEAVLPAGVAIDGVSLVPYVRNQTSAPTRQYIYAEEFPIDYDERYERAIANCCYKLIERADGSREFYDLKADPHEARNLLAGKALTAAQRSNLGTLDAQMDALLATADGG